MASIKDLIPIDASTLDGISTFAAAGHNHDNTYLHKTSGTNRHILQIAADGLTTSGISQSGLFFEENIYECVDNVTTPYQYIVPANCTRLDILAVGGGGAGGACYNEVFGYGERFGLSGVGGNGGSAIYSTISVSEGNVIDIVVGAGGTGYDPINYSGYGGTATTISKDTILVASAAGGRGGLGDKAQPKTSTSYYYRMYSTVLNNGSSTGDIVISGELGEQSLYSVTLTLNGSSGIGGASLATDQVYRSGIGGMSGLFSMCRGFNEVVAVGFQYGVSGTSAWRPPYEVYRYLGCGGSAGVLVLGSSVPRTHEGGSGAGGAVILRSYR